MRDHHSDELDVRDLQIADADIPSEPPTEGGAFFRELLLWPGLGYAYAGKPRLAWAAPVAFGACYLLATLSAALLPLGVLTVLVLPSPLILRLVMALHAGQIAARRTTPVPSTINSWLHAGLSIAIALGSVHTGRTWFAQPMSIPSAAMVPTLEVGDHLVIDRTAYLVGSPARGDVIAFDYPQDPRLTYMFRVIGLPGETVEVRAGEVLIDGVALSSERIGPLAWVDADCSQQTGIQVAEEEWSVLQEPLGTRDWGPEQVPQDAYFVLGDNRAYAHDSRVWGFVGRSQIQGKARPAWAKRNCDGQYSFF